MHRIVASSPAGAFQNQKPTRQSSLVHAVQYELQYELQYCTSVPRTGMKKLDIASFPFY